MGVWSAATVGNEPAQGMVLAASRKAQRVCSPDRGTRIRMSHLSFLSQILETAVYIFGGGGFRVGKGKGGREWGGSVGGREASAWVFYWII